MEDYAKTKIYFDGSHYIGIPHQKQPWKKRKNNKDVLQKKENEKKKNKELSNKEIFEEVYKKWTGLDYNEENVIKYQQASQLYAIGVNGLSKAENFKTSIAEASDMQEVYDAYIAYYGNEETARLKMNEFLNENYNNNENIILQNYQNVNRFVCLAYYFYIKKPK